MNGLRCSRGSDFCSGSSPIPVVRRRPASRGWGLPLLLLSFLGLASSLFAQVTLTPGTLTFPSEVVGVSSGTMTATVKNTQATPLALKSIGTSGFLGIFGGADDFSATTNCPLFPHTLAGGATCTISVTFTPTAVGLQTGAINLTDNASTPPKGVLLKGTGTAPVTVTTNNLTFAAEPVGTTSGAQTVTLNNLSKATLSVSTPVITGDFAIKSDTCTSVTAGSHCAIGVTFTPTASGVRTGTLTINDSGLGSPEVVTLMGTGADASGLVSIAVTPANPSVAAGQNQQFTATGTYIDPSHVANVTSSVTWSTGSASYATISNTVGSQGLATGVAQGSTTVTATLGAIQGSTELTVNAPTLVSIAVTPAGLSVPLTTKEQYAAIGTYSNGSMEDLTTTVTWSSSATGTATISNTSGSQGLATATGLGPTTIQAASGAIKGSTTLTVVAGSLETGSMKTARTDFTATLLNDGTVLVVGGQLLVPSLPIPTPPYASTPVDTVLATAEIYNPATGTFAYTTGSLHYARFGHTATLQDDGTVLIAGGSSAPGTSGPFLQVAEVYNPATQTFAYTAHNMQAERFEHSATLLSDGTVVLAGGDDGNALASAELYNLTGGSFNYTTGSLNTGRYLHSATLLNNGMALITGGYNFLYGVLSSAELYSRSAQTFAYTTTASSTDSCGSLSTQSCMNTPRYLDSATLLNSGMVLLAGGTGSGGVITTAEVYNPTTQAFTSTGNLITPRSQHTGTLLANGTVLLAGGIGDTESALTATELYNPATGDFTASGYLTAARYSHTATRLNNGAVLIAGGQSSSTTSLASAELYQPGTQTPPNLESIAVTPATHTISLGSSPNLQFIATGTFSSMSPEQLASVVWTSSDTTKVVISNDAGSPGWALALAEGMVTITATAGSIHGSTTLTVGP
jgi:trimeric autotransporter adhesin